MNAFLTYDQLVARLSCESNLPQVPVAAMRLCQQVEQELVSQDVLKTVSSDPALTANLLRSASSPLYALSNRPVQDVRSALSTLGVRGVKSVAMSVLMQSVVLGATKSTLDPKRFVQHSTFVGIMAKYVFLRRKQTRPFATSLNGDDVFAAGVLHDLGKGLLAAANPAVYDRISNEAKVRRTTFDSAFIANYNHNVTTLTTAALAVWKLPTVFSTLIGGFGDPVASPTDPVGSASLVLADHYAMGNGFGEGEYVPPDLNPEIVDLAGLDEAELPSAVAQVVAHTQSCLVGGRAAA
ncbi:MAG: HDOD domain-containing protein [Chthonomonadaceae bacterium]|nr:HDOD domain-containing protein [Chthonomonadaceae bacterium]